MKKYYDEEFHLSLFHLSLLPLFSFATTSAGVVWHEKGPQVCVYECVRGV
jgi:hypothetical protein